MKQYYLKFGTGDSAAFTGLTPTLVIFSAAGLTSVAAPTISEAPSGSGIYAFAYGPTISITFKCDGGAGLASGDRYVYGALDPIQAVDEKVGTINDSFGSTSVDPTTALGYLKRIQELFEGNATFIKSTGIWSMFSRGSSTLLRSKTLTNSTSEADKN